MTRNDETSNAGYIIWRQIVDFWRYAGGTVLPLEFMSSENPKYALGTFESVQRGHLISDK